MARRALGGLQRDALALYRAALRLSRARGGAAGEGLALAARERFEADASRVGRRDVQLIEHMLRKGRRQLELLAASEVSGVTAARGGK